MVKNSYILQATPKSELPSERVPSDGCALRYSSAETFSVPFCTVFCTSTFCWPHLSQWRGLIQSTAFKLAWLPMPCFWTWVEKSIEGIRVASSSENFIFPCYQGKPSISNALPEKQQKADSGCCLFTCFSPSLIPPCSLFPLPPLPPPPSRLSLLSHPFFHEISLWLSGSSAHHLLMTISKILFKKPTKSTPISANFIFLLYFRQI